MTEITEQKIDMRKASKEEIKVLAASIMGLKSFFRSQDCKICIRIRKPAPTPASPPKVLSKST